MALAELSDFVDDGIDPPRFKEVTQVRAGPANKRCGSVGYCPERECWAYLSPRLREDDPEAGKKSQFLRHRSYRGYAISDDVLAQFRNRKPQVERLFFAERDTGMVYEFQASAYLQYGTEVEFAPDNDPQTFRPVMEATHSWPDHYDELKVAPEVTIEELQE